MTQEEFQKIVLKELCSLKEDMRDVKKRLQNVARDVSVLKEDVTILKGQAAENTSILKVVLHNREFAQAKAEGPEKSTVSVDLRAIEKRQRIHSESINLLASRQL